MDESSTLKLPFRKNISFLEETKLYTNNITKYGINQKSDPTVNVNGRMSMILDETGLTNQTISSYITNVVNSSVTQKTSIDKTQTNLSRYDVSAKPKYMKSRRPADEIRNKKEELLGKEDLPYGGLSFPEGITDKVSYMQLSIRKYSRPSSYEAGDAMNDVMKIYLPIPENLSTVDSVTYAQRETGFYGDALNSDLAQKKISEAKASGSVISALTSWDREDVSGAAQLIQEIGKRASYATLESANEIVGGLAGQIAGEIPNPHPSIFFKGLELRTFTLSWKLVPRSAAESSILNQIILSLRSNFLPSSSGGFLNYPHLLKPAIVRSSGGATTVQSYKNCVVRTLTINYTPEGTSAFFHDGMPCSIVLNMDIQEVENYTSEDVYNDTEFNFDEGE